MFPVEIRGYYLKNRYEKQKVYIPSFLMEMSWKKGH